MTPTESAASATPAVSPQPTTRGGLTLAIAAALAGLLGYTANIILTRSLGPVGFGALGALLGLAVIASVAATVLQLEIARVAASPAGVSDAEALRVTLVVSVLTTALLLAATPLLMWALHLDHPTYALSLALFVLPQTLMGGILGLLLGRSRLLAFATFVLVMATGRVGAAGLTALAGGGPTFALVVSAAAGFVAILAGLWWLRREPDSTQSDHGRAARSWMTGMVRAASGAGSLLVLLNIDLLVSRSLLTSHDSGWYAFLIIFGRVTFWGTSFLSLWIFPRVAAEGGAQRSIKIALLIIVALGVCAVSGVMLLGEPLVRILAGPAYAGSEVDGPWFAAIGAMMALVQLAVYVDVARSRHQLSWWVWGASGVIALAAVILRPTSIISIAQLTTMVLLTLSCVCVASVLRGSTPLSERPRASCDRLRH